MGVHGRRGGYAFARTWATNNTKGQRKQDGSMAAKHRRRHKHCFHVAWAGQVPRLGQTLAVLFIFL
jgi:hypothetical protein